MTGPISSTSPNTLGSTVAVDIKDDILLTLGDDSDIAVLLNSAGLASATELTGVFEGTSVKPTIAASTLIISNVTDDGDIIIAASDNGDSKACLFFDASTPDTYLYNVGGTWTAGATTWTIPAVTLGGALTGNATLTGDAYIDISPTLTGNASTDVHAVNISPVGITIPAGTTAIASSLYVAEPIFTETGTLTLGTTVYIASAPSEGTTNYALYVASGGIYAAGTVTLDSASFTTTSIALSQSVIFSDTNNRVDDDKLFYWGTGYDAAVIWETADDNAHMLQLHFATAGAGNSVPVLAIGDVTIALQDLGSKGFDASAITEPTVVMVNNAADGFLSIDAGDVNGSPAGLGLYFLPAADEDVALLKVGVTEAPALIWDDSETEFYFDQRVNALSYAAGGTDGIDESGSGTITTFTITIVKGIVTAFAKVS